MHKNTPQQWNQISIKKGNQFVLHFHLDDMKAYMQGQCYLFFPQQKHTNFDWGAKKHGAKSIKRPNLKLALKQPNHREGNTLLGIKQMMHHMKTNCCQKFTEFSFLRGIQRSQRHDNHQQFSFYEARGILTSSMHFSYYVAWLKGAWQVPTRAPYHWCILPPDFV